MVRHSRLGMVARSADVRGIRYPTSDVPLCVGCCCSRHTSIAPVLIRRLINSNGKLRAVPSKGTARSQSVQSVSEGERRTSGLSCWGPSGFSTFMSRKRLDPLSGGSQRGKSDPVSLWCSRLFLWVTGRSSIPPSYAVRCAPIAFPSPGVRRSPRCGAVPRCFRHPERGERPTDRNDWFP